MRILITTGVFPPEIGGPATYVPIIASSLYERGHRVCVIAPEEKGMDCPILDPPYQIIRFSHARFLRFVNFFIELWRAFSIILKNVNDYEIIYINGLNLAATLVCLLKRKPSVVKVVGDGAWEFAYNRGWTSLNLDEFQTAKGWRFDILRLIHHTAAKRANSVIVPSYYLARIIKTWGVHPAQIQVVYNVIPIPKDEIETYPPDDNDIGFEGGLRLVTVGRLVSHKRIEGIINILAEDIPNARLTIIGEGPERENLEILVTYLGLEDRVQFTGQISPIKLRGALQHKFDIFILNSVYEGFSHSLLEAAHCGLPIIATSVGGNVEVIVDNENGILIPPESDFALLDAILRLQKDQALCQQLISNARQSMERFSLDRMFNETESALFKAIR